MSQIIDIGNSGIQFANPGVIDLGGHGSGIQIIGPHGIASKYLLKMSGIKDLVSKASQTDTSAGSAYYIHPNTGELVTVAAGEPLIHPTLGNVSLPAYEQLCQDSEDPGEWSVNGSAIVTATMRETGPFQEYRISSGGDATDGCIIWKSTISGIPSDILYFNVRYLPGTSNQIRLAFYNINAGWVDSKYYGAIDSAKILTSSAGVLTIYSDEYNDFLGYYELKGCMSYTNLSSDLRLFFCPNTAFIGDSILVLGADISEDPAILDFHVPSSGSNVTIASRAGTTKLAGLADNFPKFYDALGGVADGVELFADLALPDVMPSNSVVTDLFAITATSSGPYVGMYIDGIQAGGTRYEISFEAKSSVAQDNGFTGIVNTDDVGVNPTNPNLTTEYQKYKFRVVASNTRLKWYTTVLNIGDIINLKNYSNKAISPAAARHTFTWTPGVSYTDHTTVESIMTPSDADGFLKASAAGGFELSDGTNTLSLESVNWSAGTPYPMEIVYGYNEALDAYKMELSVYVDGSWVSVMGDFDQYFDIGDPADFIFGLSNPYQSSVKGLITEKLAQSHWRS